MCIDCDRLAPRCPHLQAISFEDFCAGWDLTRKETFITDDEYADICADLDLTDEGPQDVKECDPDAPPTRLSILRVGMTPPGPRIPVPVAR